HARARVGQRRRVAHRRTAVRGSGDTGSAPVLAPRATRNCSVPPQLRARTGAAGRRSGVPAPAPRAAARVAPSVCDPGATDVRGGTGRRRGDLRSSRARPQLRGDAALTSRAWSEDAGAAAAPRPASPPVTRLRELRDGHARPARRRVRPAGGGAVRTLGEGLVDGATERTAPEPVDDANLGGAG